MRARVLLSLAALLLLLVGLAGTDPADAAERRAGVCAERWLAPVRGGPTRRFHLGPDPFLGGQHRGVDLAAHGGPVRAACAGRVVFAGRVAASPTVSMRCGRWRVSYAPLERVGVREGARVGAGARLGRAGRELHFGVRREGRRFGYVDPLGFLAGRRAPPPPRGRAAARASPSRPRGPAAAARAGGHAARPHARAVAGLARPGPAADGAARRR